MTDLTNIHHYQIKEILGRGGTATVYLAYDPHTERKVAIKLLRESLCDNEQARARFLQEAQLLTNLHHPAIVSIFDSGEYKRRLYLVMPYMPGGSLRGKLEMGAVSLSETIHILQQIVPALDLAHQQQIIHRDLKPHNIMLGDDGQAYLCDFGVARLIDHDNPEQTVTLIGTPEYMAPEQVLEGTLSRQTDIYQLGVVLFHMLTGQRPFEGSTHQVMTQHLQAPVPSVEALNPSLPAGCDAIIQRAMTKEPSERYMSAGDLLHDLMAVNQLAESAHTVTYPHAPTPIAFAHTEEDAGNPAPSTPPPSPPSSRWTGKRVFAWGAGTTLTLSLIVFLIISAFAPAPQNNGNGRGNGNNNNNDGRRGAANNQTTVVTVPDLPDALNGVETVAQNVVDAIVEIPQTVQGIVGGTANAGNATQNTLAEPTTNQNTTNTTNAQTPPNGSPPPPNNDDSQDGQRPPRDNQRNNNRPRNGQNNNPPPPPPPNGQN